METTALAKWNKDKLIQEILKLRESKRTSLLDVIIKKMDGIISTIVLNSDTFG